MNFSNRSVVSGHFFFYFFFFCQDHSPWCFFPNGEPPQYVVKSSVTTNTGMQVCTDFPLCFVYAISPVLAIALFVLPSWFLNCQQMSTSGFRCFQISEIFANHVVEMFQCVVLSGST